MDPIEKHSFRVQPFEVDFRGRVAFPTLVNNLLNAAGHHADYRGFGMKQLNQEGNTWVLSRVLLQIEKLPLTEDDVMIETWLENVVRSFTFRNFAIHSNGECIGYARTIWAMINTESRKPASLEGKGIHQYIYKEKDCPLEKIVKINILNEPSPAEDFTVKFSDLDINCHMNSAKYIEHIFDVFSPNEMIDKSVKRFEIEYLEECRYGEKLTLCRESDCGVTSIVLKKSDGTDACKCRITLA